MLKHLTVAASKRNITQHLPQTSMTPQMCRLGRGNKCQHLKLSSGKYLNYKLLTHLPMASLTGVPVLRNLL